MYLIGLSAMTMGRAGCVIIVCVVAVSCANAGRTIPQAQAITLLQAAGLPPPWHVAHTAHPRRANYWLVTGYAAPRAIAADMCRFQGLDIDVERVGDAYEVRRRLDHTVLALAKCEHATPDDLHPVDVEIQDDELVSSIRAVLAVIRSQDVPRLTLSMDANLRPYVSKLRPGDFRAVHNTFRQAVQLSFFSLELFPRYFVFEFARAKDGSATLSVDADNELHWQRN
jgi:hypothetical protein